MFFSNKNGFPIIFAWHPSPKNRKVARPLEGGPTPPFFWGQTPHQGLPYIRCCSNLYYCLVWKNYEYCFLASDQTVVEKLPFWVAICSAVGEVEKCSCSCLWGWGWWEWQSGARCSNWAICPALSRLPSSRQRQPRAAFHGDSDIQLCTVDDMWFLQSWGSAVFFSLAVGLSQLLSIFLHCIRILFSPNIFICRYFSIIFL